MVYLTDDFAVSRAPIVPGSLGKAAEKVVNRAARISKGLRDFVKNVQEEMDASNGFGWHVLAGKDFAVEIHHKRKACILLSSKKCKLKVLIYRTITQVTAVPSKQLTYLVTPEDAPQRNAKIFECDMDDETKTDVLRTVQCLIDHHHDSPEPDASLAKDLKHSLSFNYGPNWQVIVAKKCELAGSIHGDALWSLDLLMDGFRILVYRHSGMQSDMMMEMTLQGIRGLYILVAICAVVYGIFQVAGHDLWARCDLQVEDDAVEQLLEVESPARDSSRSGDSACSPTERRQARQFATYQRYSLLVGIALFVTASMLRYYRRSLQRHFKQQ